MERKSPSKISFTTVHKQPKMTLHNTRFALKSTPSWLDWSKSRIASQKVKLGYRMGGQRSCVPLLVGAIMFSAVAVVSPDVGRASPLGGETFLFGPFKWQPVSEVANRHPEYIRQLKGQPEFARNFPKLFARLEQHTASVGIGSLVSPAHVQGKTVASLEQEQSPIEISSDEIGTPTSPASDDVVSPARGDGKVFASLDKEQPAPVSVEIGSPISPASAGIGPPVSPCHGEGTSLEQEQLAAPSVEAGWDWLAAAEVGSPVSATPRDGDRDEICWWGKHKGRLVSVIHKIDPGFFERSLKYHPEVANKDRLYYEFLERNKSPPIVPNQRNLSSWFRPIFHGRHWSEPPTPHGAQRSNVTTEDRQDRVRAQPLTRTVEDNNLPPGTSPAKNNTKAKSKRKNVLRQSKSPSIHPKTVTRLHAATTSPRSPPLRQRSPATSGLEGKLSPSPRARRPASPRVRKNPPLHPRARPSASQKPSSIAPLRLQVQPCGRP